MERLFSVVLTPRGLCSNTQETQHSRLRLTCRGRLLQRLVDRDGLTGLDPDLIGVIPPCGRNDIGRFQIEVILVCPHFFI